MNDNSMKTTTPWAVLWDVDGTLVDTAELHFQSWAALARAIDKPFTLAHFAATFGWRNQEIIPKLFGVANDDEVRRLGDEKEKLYRAEAQKGVALLPGVQSLLDALSATSGKQAIGSSAPRANIELILRMTRTTPCFAAVVSMEDTTRGKPDPEVFLMGAHRLGIPPARCIVLEDAPAGIQAAKAGGMRAVGVTFVGHHSVENLQAAGADLVVPTLEQVTTEKMLEMLVN
jgi:beta-phosphoglucomutase